MIFWTLEYEVHSTLWLTRTHTLVDCGSLQSPSNGDVTYTATTVGSVATYTCNAGYELNGVSVRACQIDGTWSGSQPSCFLSTNPRCSLLSSPSNGQVTLSGIRTNDYATYSCSAGYTLSGTSRQICQNDGTWSGSQPHCDAVDCGLLTAPSNGDVSASSTTFTSVANYR